MRNRRRAPHEQRPGRAWADLPLRAKGLVVVAIPLLALLLVGERGWAPERWERWFADTACAQLLRGQHPSP